MDNTEFVTPSLAELFGNNPHLLITASSRSAAEKVVAAVKVQAQEDGQTDVRLASDTMGVSTLLAALDVEMSERYEIFARAGFVSLKAWNRDHETNESLRKIVVIVNEADEFVSDQLSGPAIVQHLSSLAMKGRGAGIAVVVIVSEGGSLALPEIVTDLFANVLTV